MFIRLELDDESDHEWGWNSEIAPVVGDFVWLYYEKPNEEATGNDFLEAVITKRMILVSEDGELWLTAHCDESVPDGYIADSPAWPSEQESVRRKSHERDLERIRSGESLGDDD